MIWSREEDMTHDFYRPISQCRGRGRPRRRTASSSALHVRVSGQSINAFLNQAAAKDGKDDRQLQGYYEKPGDAQLGYTVPNLLIEYAMRNTHVPVGPWRGVNTNQNAVYMECFIDEVARAAGNDPVEFRRALMQKHPKHLAVLNAVAAKADWGKPLPAGVHRGVAQFMGYGSYSAAVAEVSVSDKGKVKVHRMVLGARIAATRSIPTRSRRRSKARSRTGLSRGALRRVHRRQGPHRRDQLPHLRDPAARRDAEGRDGDRADVRLLGRRRRADDLRRGARGAERDLSRRPASRCAACRSRICRWCDARWRRMSARRACGIAVAADRGGLAHARRWRQAPPSPPIRRDRRCRCTSSATAFPSRWPQSPATPARGLRLVVARDAANCVLCHAVPDAAVRFSGDVGPSLAGVGRALDDAAAAPARRRQHARASGDGHAELLQGRRARARRRAPIAASRS